MVVDVIRWLEQGDHSAIVQPFHDPIVPSGGACPKCGKRMGLHGSMATGRGRETVCPGDYILTEPNGERRPERPKAFSKLYEKIIKEPTKTVSSKKEGDPE